MSDLMTDYRSIAFVKDPDHDVIRRAADLGFTDLCVHDRMTVDAKTTLDRNGAFDLADELGLTTTLWASELDDLRTGWGPVDVENDRLWQAIADRYRYRLSELFPDLDHVALKVVESDTFVQDRAQLRRLVETMNDVCRETDTTLIFRSFVHQPEHLEEVVAAAEEMPDDVVFQSKDVPQDWHLRSVDHPFIGQFPERTEIVETDVAGEYFRRDQLANCFTELLAERFGRWTDRGVDGISVRVNWHNNEWVGGRNRPYWAHQYKLTREPQEANLWALGYLATGRGDVDDAWSDYGTERFGPAAAEAVERAFRPTGEVVAEALCVGRETFGDTRQQIPAIRTMRDRTATRRSDAEAEDVFRGVDEGVRRINPFAQNWSVWRWDDSFVDDYHRLRTGHPSVIDEKEAGYESASRTAAACLDAFADARPHLSEGRYDYHRFRLEETQYHLDVMCHAALAWLYASNDLYYADDPEGLEGALDAVHGHLEDLRALADRKGESRECVVDGDAHRLERGRYVDPAGYVEEFTRYWGL